MGGTVVEVVKPEVATVAVVFPQPQSNPASTIKAARGAFLVSIARFQTAVGQPGEPEQGSIDYVHMTLGSDPLVPVAPLQSR